MKQIQSRRGSIILSKQILFEADEDILKLLFSNFFPVAIEPDHQTQGYWGAIKYFGYSPHFEEIEGACIAPEYEVIINKKRCETAKELFKTTIEFKKIK